MSKQPGVIQIGRMSWDVLMEVLERMPSVLGSGLGIYALCQILDLLMQWVVRPALGAQIGTNTIYVALLATAAAKAIVIAAVAVPVHRLVLADEVSPGGVALFHPRTLRYARWVFAFELTNVIVLLSVLAVILRLIEPVLLRVLLWLVVSGGLLFVAVRLCAVFPAAAIDHPAEGLVSMLRNAWKFSRGRFWRMFGSVVVAVVPLIAAVGIVTMLLSGFSVAISATPSPSEAKTVGFWIALLASDVIQVFGAALTAAVLALNYRFAGGSTALAAAETFA